jgi:hypothetical protein
MWSAASLHRIANNLPRTHLNTQPDLNPVYFCRGLSCISPPRQASIILVIHQREGFTPGTKVYVNHNSCKLKGHPHETVWLLKRGYHELSIILDYSSALPKRSLNITSLTTTRIVRIYISVDACECPYAYSLLLIRVILQVSKDQWSATSRISLDFSERPIIL